LLIFILVTTSATYSQTKPKKIRFSGFLEYLNNTWVPQGKAYQTLGIDEWQMQGGVYNRLNLWYNPTTNLEFYVGMRNNFIFGPMFATYTNIFNFAGLNYSDLVTYDPGYLDLTFKIAGNNSYILYTNFDRANVKWTLDKFEVTLGRQRINWGQNLIWNPNDIFNAYNFFDFNYVERPGSDAVLMELFTGDFSSVQLAGKLSYIQVPMDTSVLILREELKLTAAAMYRFSKWNYDWQVFGGVMETDVTAGLGWAGSVAGAGFTGELSWFRDTENFADTTGVFVGSIGANYTFRNSIFINFSAIYNSAGKMDSVNAIGTGFLGSFSTIFSSSLNAKNLTRARLDLFGQISYPVTPLINIDLASIFNPYDLSGFIGPTVNFSLSDNISLGLVGQLFWGKPYTEYGDIGQMFFLDLKWSF
jgi:fluoride ion exporter CrcB/FEX